MTGAIDLFMQEITKFPDVSSAVHAGEAMDTWRAVYLGTRELPQALNGFELQAFFNFDRADRAAIDARQSDAHKLGLALHIGFLRMSGRLLDTFRVVPPTLWRHLGQQLDIDPPERCLPP